MITRELLSLLDVTKAQAFYIHELTEVAVICKDEDLIFEAFQVVPPSLKSLNNGQELLIMSLIVNLSGNHFSREKSN